MHGHDSQQSELFESLRLIAKVPLFDGEQTVYDDLLKQVYRAVIPADIFEKIWICDYVYYTIEVLRLRRVEVNLIRLNEPNGLTNALKLIGEGTQAENLAQDWASRKPDGIKDVKRTFRSAGLSSSDCILAETFAFKLNELDRIKHLRALAEARRDAILREIDRHRQSLGEKLRRLAQQAEDDQLNALDSAPISVGRSD